MATETAPPSGAPETTDPNAPSIVQDATNLATLAEKVRQLEASAPDNVHRRDLEHFATKADLHAAVANLQASNADLHKSMVRQTWMIVGAIFLAGTLMVAALKLIPPV